MTRRSHALRALPLLALALGATALQAQTTKSVTLLRDLETDRYDPHRTTARGAAEVLFMAGDTLVGLDYDLKKPVPALAKSWTVSDDGLTYTFKLRENVTFCSGKKMTSQDVADSYKRWLDPATKGLEKWRAGPVDSITTPDPYTVVYKLKRPYADLLRQMSQHSHTVINLEQVKALGADFGVKGFDGTGPYCFQSWTPRNEVVLTRHEGYDWGPAIYADPRPKVDRVVWKIVPEETTRLTALQTNQADATRYLPYYALKDLKASRNLSASKAPVYNWTFFVGFKIDKPGVSDEKVRQAMNLAVDRKTLTDIITFGNSTPATSMLATDTPTPGQTPFHFDPARANKLLDEAGWVKKPDGFRYKDGVKLSPLLYGIAGYWKDILEAVQGDLRKVGVDLRVQLFDSTVAWGKLATQEFDMFSIGFGYMSTGEGLNNYFISTSVPTPNRMNWKDPETDKLLSEGDSARDPAAADKFYSQVLGKTSAAAVWIPLFHDSLWLVNGPRLKPLKAHGIEGTAFYKGLDFAWK
ncbi:ABC transporter substrate-binding protein [Xylophilus rhododendri]|uniref:ABC transporter substrate-binding protein n=1 Tax=Xylophilus rhododendri TaxID=2697032 RepID=A0A857J675_9BURK|nr:ABC transporter substrate-binding protein [Xylophilus rhododendri]QHI98501.1 ABC transporter substrate-binding protein [Xylophilus rhododendri]